MAWLPDGEKKLKMSCLFVLTESTNVTDTQTTPHVGRACIASRGKMNPIHHPPVFRQNLNSLVQTYFQVGLQFLLPVFNDGADVRQKRNGCQYRRTLYSYRQSTNKLHYIKSSGLVLGRRPLGVVLHSSNEPGKLSQWLCHDDSTINIVMDIIIIITVVERWSLTGELSLSCARPADDG